MLRSLVIRDLAIIAGLELELKPGLTVITGETGAGKSILLDGLTLIAGARAEAAMVRSGAERAEVEAEFAVPVAGGAAQWLGENELEDAGVCLLRRTVRADGGSRAWINGRASSLQQARELTAELVEIHGQHEYQRLLERSHQLDLLDRYGNHLAVLEAVGKAAAEVHRLSERRRALEAQAGQSGALLELARAQLTELEALKPSRERLAGIEEQHRRLSHAGALQQGLSGAAQRLAGEEAQTALRQIRLAQSELSRLSGVDSRLGEVVGRLESVRLELEDIGGWLSDQAESLDLDPAALQRSERELSALHDLARRHRVALSALPDKLEELRARVLELGGLDAELSGLAEAEAMAQQRWTQAAQNLSALRQKTAARFARAVEKLLGELGMSGARFVLELSPRAADDYAARGAEQCEFLVSANAGQPPRPMRKVASGGELSRISLAIKVATLDIADTPVLVFDEVDAGIGGPTAAMVGRKLRALGAKRQVLVVTHSPQVAASGHQHWHVGKQTRQGQTRSVVQVLDEAQRIEELARMLGGEVISEQTRGNARELLVGAQ
jgi:DNA repair protein RecN (Recombination protein N)